MTQRYGRLDRLPLNPSGERFQGNAGFGELIHWFRVNGRSIRVKW